MDDHRHDNKGNRVRMNHAIGGAACLGILLGGCSGGAAGIRSSDAARISPSDFQAATSETDTPTGIHGEPAPAPRIISAREARGGDPDVLTLVGRPARLDGPPSVSDRSTRPATSPSTEGAQGWTGPQPIVVERDHTGIVVDEMVGQINGRPVYAAEFLRNIDDFLRAEAIEKTPQEWLRVASQLIQNQLLERIRDELLIAEFNASLSYDERVGLFAFIDQIQQGIIDRDLGSAARADERLRTEENVSLRGKAQEQFNREIVFEQLRREVTRKVQVSWRDIRRYYDQNQSVFQPASTARLRVLRVSETDRERMESVLNDGSSIIGVIERETTFRRPEGGLIELELGPDGMSGAEFFGPSELNDPARALGRGDLSRPITFNNAVWWLYLEDILQPEAVSLYEAQNRIEQAIRAEREQQERARYFERLFGSSAMTENQLIQMRDRLIRFAVDRYLAPEDRPEG